MSTLQMNSAIESEQQTDRDASATAADNHRTPARWLATDERSADDLPQGNLPMNVNDWERIASLGIGVITLFFLARRLLIYLIVAAIGAYLILRGMTGHCTLYAWANLTTRQASDNGSPDRAPASTSKKEPELARAADDEVTEALRDSFPASDPPPFYR